MPPHGSVNGFIQVPVMWEIVYTDVLFFINCICDPVSSLRANKIRVLCKIFFSHGIEQMLYWFALDSISAFCRDFDIELHKQITLV